MDFIPKPDSYSSLIGTVSLFLASLCLAISFCEKKQPHATKLFSIILVTALSLFASHWTTYFAAIFIVATAVTELEFLQNLAAIIRKDKNYFDYKTETLTQSENIRRQAKDVIEQEYEAENLSVPTGPDTKINLADLDKISTSALMKLHYSIEEKALNFLSNRFGPIKSGVRFRKGSESIEVDGVASGESGEENILFEIKWCINSRSLRQLILFGIKKCAKISRTYESITGNKPTVNLVLVTNQKTENVTTQFMESLNKTNESNINLIHLSLDEIGFHVVDKTH